MNFKNIFGWTISFFVIASLGVYFRTYSLHHNQSPSAARLMAALFVENVMIENFKKELSLQSPNLAGEDQLRRSRELARNKILSDQVGYELSIKKVMQKYASDLPKDSGRKYLLEADPYYYFYLTEQIIDNGKLSPKTQKGQYYHPLMHAPDGLWTSTTWHPYVGYAIGRVIQCFKPQMEWMERLCWVPLVLSVLACLSFVFLAWALRMEWFSFLMGALVLMLSPIFIQRSAFGWYDTDPYNYIFSFSILALLMTGLRYPNFVFRCAFGSGFLTGLYALFWTGWPFIFILLPASLVGAYVVAFFFLKTKTKIVQVLLRYLIMHGVASIIFTSLFLTPTGVLRSIQEGWDILLQFLLQKNDVWPNIFITVGEARGVSLNKLISLTGNYITFSVALFGLGSSFYRSLKSVDSEKIAQVIILFLFSIPLFFLALKTERFGILVVIPLSIWTMFGAREIMHFFANLTSTKKMVFRILMLALFLPLPLIKAHQSSFNNKPIMDDAWYDSLQALREKTPPNSVVNSWWPPGYFISSFAHRKVVVDGGTQHLHETYWLAKIFATQDERHAAGLLRMLNTSGNRALLFLQSLGFDLSDAIDLINSVVALPRSEVHLPDKLSIQTKNEFLDLTHPMVAAPSYVLVYTDMINQNIAVTMVDRWDFRKARETQQSVSGNKLKSYLQKLRHITGGTPQSTPPLEVIKKEGNEIFFSNGLTVNLETMDASVTMPGKKLPVKPASIFFMKEGKLVEKVFDGNRFDGSVLLFQPAEGVYRCVLADAELIRSLMFRLYYLKGEGLHHFEFFTWNRNALTGDQVGIFELVEPVKNSKN